MLKFLRTARKFEKRKEKMWSVMNQKYCHDLSSGKEHRNFLSRKNSSEGIMDLLVSHFSATTLFHIVVVQRRQGNVPKSVMHVDPRAKLLFR